MAFIKQATKAPACYSKFDFLMLLNNDITHHFSEFISIYKKTSRMQTATAILSITAVIQFSPENF